MELKYFFIYILLPKFRLSEAKINSERVILIFIHGQPVLPTVSIGHAAFAIPLKRQALP